MFIAPSTLAYARARHRDLEREADHERLLRAARAALRACCGDVADETCCAPGCCDEPGCCVGGPEHCVASPSGARDAARSSAWRRRAGGVAALLLRAVRSLRPSAATRCASAAATTHDASAAATRCAPSCAGA
jgi:hypothetical protein